MVLIGRGGVSVGAGLGILRAILVDDNSAEAKIVNGSGFKVGDMAKTTTQ